MVTAAKKPTAALMLLGAFHFQDPGLDVYKSQLEVDVLSDKRQREVEEVVRRKAFAPTKVAVECRLEHQAKTDEDYRPYRRGAFSLSGDEVRQLGFRLAKAAGLERVYCVDVWGRSFEPPVDLEALETVARQHGQEGLLSKWRARLQAFGEAGEARKMQLTLREALLELNSEGSTVEDHGLYLTGWFGLGAGDEYPGVDYVTS